MTVEELMRVNRMEREKLRFGKQLKNPQQEKSRERVIYKEKNSASLKNILHEETYHIPGSCTTFSEYTPVLAGKVGVYSDFAWPRYQNAAQTHGQIDESSASANSSNSPTRKIREHDPPHPHATGGT